MTCGAMEKEVLRTQIREKLAMLSSSEKEVQALHIFAQIEALPAFINANDVLLYWSMAHEVPTHAFVDKWAVSKNIYLPVIKDDRLGIVKYTGHSNFVKHARYKTWEPVGRELADFGCVDLVLVPGVAFDSAGRRLGRGGGFYDRLLPLLPNAYKAGLAFEQQMVDLVPCAPHDVTLDLVISPK